MGISSIIFLFPFFVLAFWLSKTILTTFQSKTVKLPPGPRKLPLIGHLHLLAAHYSDPLCQYLRDLAKKYGPLMHLQIGEVPAIVVTSSEIAKEFYKTHESNFLGRPSLLAGEVLFYNNAEIAFAQYGDYWRQVRKICTMELLSMKRVQSFQPVREEEFLNFCRWIASNEGSPISLTERIYSTANEITTRVALGKKTGLPAKLSHIIEQNEGLSLGFEMVDFFPSFKFLRQVGGLKYAQRLHRQMDEILEEIIVEHQANNNAHEKTHENFLDALLKFHVDAGGGEEYTPLTSDNIKAILLDMLVGGVGSPVTLEWAIAELLKHPKLMKKAQDEVRNVYDKQGYVDDSHINELAYTKSVVKECFRLHPPATLLPVREGSEACVIDGYDIPAKARILVNVWAMGRDPNYWKDPEKFIPERFIDGSVDFRGNNYEYIPFGAGKRMCPGMVFAVANIEFPLAMLLYHFDLVPANGVKPEEMDMTVQRPGLLSRLAKPLHVIPLVKRPLPCK
uniref:Cytochrome P450 n=1 Tax=Scoparia dulcis TaxID=107240 RepID=A0A1W7HBU2_SCODU